MIIFSLPPWWLLLFIVCIIAMIFGLIQNIGSIILVVITVIVIILLFLKWPVKTLIGLVCIIVTCFVVSSVSSSNEVNKTPVRICIATDTCIFFDEQDNIVQIPSGAVVADFWHPEQKSKEQNVNANSLMCYWFYGDEVFSSTISIRHSLADANKVEDNRWNLAEIREITYKEFQSCDWWT